MTPSRFLHVVMLSLAITLTIGLSSITASAESLRDPVVGAVYTMTNDPGGNAVLVFNRSEHGTLTFGGSFPTGGLGTGGREPDFGLGNAGALTLSADLSLLFVVNPGSDDVSVFAVERDGLRLLDRQKLGRLRRITLFRPYHVGRIKRPSSPYWRRSVRRSSRQFRGAPHRRQPYRPTATGMGRLAAHRDS